MRNETVFYKSPNRPVNILNGKPWVKGVVSDFHIHPEFEFLYVKSGALCVKTNNKNYIVNSGEIIFISGRAPHSTEFMEDGTSHILVQFRNPSSFKKELKYVSYFLEQNSPHFFIFKKDDEDYDGVRDCIFDMLEKNSNKNIASDYYITSNIYRLLAILYKKELVTSEENLIDLKNINRLLPAFEYIGNSYDRQITLDDIASSLTLNKEYMCRLFKKVMGITVFDYLNFVRICKAEELFDSHMNISEIAYSVGFSSLSYFNKVFKKYRRCTPSNYRKIYKNSQL